MHYYFFRAVKRLNETSYIYSGMYTVSESMRPTKVLEEVRKMLLNKEPKDVVIDITNFNRL